MPPVLGMSMATSEKVSAANRLIRPPMIQASMPMPGAPPVAW